MTADVFDRIYRRNAWRGRESRSGPGSGDAATRRVGPAIVDLTRRLGVASVLDVGCGDGYWMPDLHGYVGFDWSSEALRFARGNHPDRTYVGDWPDDVFDMVIVRDVIQHLPFREGTEVIREARRRAGKVLVASTYSPGWNVDIAAGKFYSPDLTSDPFILPEPDRLIFDGYHYHETDDIRDPAKHLGVWLR
jgi:SAM-dependent methyltransferase